MRPWQAFVASSVVLALVGALLLIPSRPRSSAVEPLDRSFTPVSPHTATHAALASNLKQVHDWLDEKDLLSAGQAAQGLAVVAQLHGYQSQDPAWREKTVAFQQSCDELIAAARAKDAAACGKHVQECERILADLAKNPPIGDKVVEKEFRPFGSTKAWMLLIDGDYVDAKSAETAKEVETLAQIIAEEANVISHLRADGPWRKSAIELRETALGAAKHAGAGDLESARSELKKVYAHCAFCHQGFKR